MCKSIDTWFFRSSPSYWPFFSIFRDPNCLALTFCETFVGITSSFFMKICLQVCWRFSVWCRMLTFQLILRLIWILIGTQFLMCQSNFYRFQHVSLSLEQSLLGQRLNCLNRESSCLLHWQSFCFLVLRCCFLRYHWNLRLQSFWIHLKCWISL